MIKIWIIHRMIIEFQKIQINLLLFSFPNLWRTLNIPRIVSSLLSISKRPFLSRIFQSFNLSKWFFTVKEILHRLSSGKIQQKPFVHEMLILIETFKITHGVYSVVNAAFSL